MNIPAILKQPTTIKGIAAVAGVLTGAATHLALHDTTLTATIGGLVYGLVHIALPDNSGAPSSVEQLVTDAATAVAQKRLAAAMPQLLADTLAVVQSVQGPHAPVPLAPAPGAAAPVPLLPAV